MKPPVTKNIHTTLRLVPHTLSELVQAVKADHLWSGACQCPPGGSKFLLVTTSDSRPLIGHIWPGQAAGLVWYNLVFADSDSDRVIFSVT